MPIRSDATVPPAYAWDWVGRQRLVWAEARRRLAPPPAGPVGGTGRPSDVPDWSELLERGPVLVPAPPPPVDGAAGGARPTVDWSLLATRSEVMTALRASYPADPTVREAVDGAVADVAFLGRRGGDLTVLGVRTPPRGLRWWWAHLGGDAGEDPAGTTTATLGVQLTLVDVMTGYGDPAPVG